MKTRAIVGVIICILLAALTCVPALADAIFEPNDTFYQKEFKNCVYHNRYYTANGDDGAVAILKEPGSGETVASVNNGNEFYVSFTYTDQDGADWGVVMFNADSAGNLGETDYSNAESGWIRMTDLKLVYDYISFAEDHQSEFTSYTGTYGEFKAAEQVVFWTYPGSGVIAWENDSMEIDDYFSISQTYTDTESSVWGFVDYWYGARNVWVCISDPAGAQIDTAPTPTPGNSAAVISPTGEVTPVKNNPSPMLLVIVAAVAVLVVVTGVIIAVFWKKSARKDKAIK